MSAPMGRAAFVARTVDWINRDLLPVGVAIDADTPLFANGLIDSIRVLRLIAWTEHALDLRIPDARIRMDYFRTVRTMADTFVAPESGTGDSNVAA
jgi:acyl carrier protein